VNLGACSTGSITAGLTSASGIHGPTGNRTSVPLATSHAAASMVLAVQQPFHPAPRAL
jgi:hypothetical protein